MTWSAVLLALVALNTHSPVAPAADGVVPITVTGHPWAPFISPMGEPFRARSTSDDTLAAWFERADRDHDGVLTVEEMVADAERFFASLDTNHDGQIDPDELNHYEWEVAPEIQVNSRTRRPPGSSVPGSSDDQPGHGKASNDEDGGSTLASRLQGAARYALLNIPEPVAAADADLNRATSLDEFRRAAVERFQLLDASKRGGITLAELQSLRQRLQGLAARRKHGHDYPDERLGNPLPKEP